MEKSKINYHIPPWIQYTCVRNCIGGSLNDSMLFLCSHTWKEDKDSVQSWDKNNIRRHHKYRNEFIFRHPYRRRKKIQGRKEKLHRCCRSDGPKFMIDLYHFFDKSGYDGYHLVMTDVILDIFNIRLVLFEIWEDRKSFLGFNWFILIFCCKGLNCGFQDYRSLFL